MRKRLLSVFLCVCMVLTLMPCTAFAAETTPPKEGWCGSSTYGVHWELTGATGNLTLTLTGQYNQKGAMADFKESKVQPWYYYKDEITQVVVATAGAPFEAGQITKIGNFAFSELTSLKTVTLSEGITSIGNYAFQSCKSLQKLVLPYSVTKIGKGAFQDCVVLTEITIPNEKLAVIEEDTFLGCKSLRTIKRDGNDDDDTFSGVTQIGAKAFKGCAALRAIHLPAVKKIGIEAFCDCAALGTVTLPEDDSVTEFTEITDGVFKNCKALSSIDIPWTVATIGREAFAGTGLERIRIPEQVITIKDGAFSGITGKATEVIFTVNGPINGGSHTDRTFGKNVFGNSQLGTVEFETCTEVIKDGWFDGCSLTKMVIPASVITIQPDAFTNCTGVTEFEVKPENRKYKSVDGILFNYNLEELIRYPVKKPGADYILPGSVTKIAPNAFYNNEVLTKVTLDGGDAKTLTIGANAFKDCTKLASVVFGSRVKEIGNSAFEGDSRLTAVALPDTVVELGEAAFKDCTAVATLRLSKSLSVLSKSAFENCQKLKKVEIPDQMKTVGDSAFKDCIAMDGLVLSPWLVTIGNHAFQNCQSLPTVHFHTGLKTIGSYAFADCTKLKGEVNIPSTVATLGNNAFANSGVESAVVPNGRLGDSAFEGCVDLAYVELGDGVTEIGQAAFADTALAQPFDLPANLETVSKEMFRNCTELVSITIPDQVTTIEEGAFAYSGVKTVYMYPLVTTIKGSKGQSTESPRDAFFESKLQSLVYYGPKSDWDHKEVNDISVAFTTAKANATFDGVAPKDKELTITFIPGEDAFTLDKTIVKITLGEDETTAKLSSKQIPEVSRTGYTFEGWALKNGKKIDPLTYEFDRDTPLYATWSEIPDPTYSVTMPLGGLATPNPAKAGEIVKLTITTSRKETFLDWSIKPSVKFVNGYSETSQTTYFVMPATDVVAVPHVLNSSGGTKYDDYIVYPGISPTDKFTADALKDLLDKILSSGDKDYYYDIELVSKSSLSVDSALEEETPEPVAMTVYGALPGEAVVYGAAQKVVIPYPDGITYSTAKDYIFSAAIVENGNPRTVSVTATSAGLELDASVSSSASVKLSVTKKATTTPTPPTTTTPPDTSKPDPTPVTYAIRDDSSKGGTVTVADEAEEGDTVTIKVKPKSGYELKDITVYNKSGKELKLKEKSDDKFTFTMPAQRVTVEATFVEEDDEDTTKKTTSTTTVNQPQMTAQDLFGPGVTGIAGIPDTNTTATGTVTGTSTATVNYPVPFADVPTTEPTRNAIGYVYNKGLMSGTSASTFSPDTTISRAMVVSILHRLEGSPSAAASSFEDVEEDQWYEKPVAWASENGIVSGYNDETFGPEDTVTKEQLVSILARYALLKKYDTVARADISEYNDADQVSQYALGAMQWAAGKQLFSANSLNLLNPTNEVTRAQAADMLMRFCQNVAKIQ